MTVTTPERRRSRRAPLRDGCWMAMPSSWRVELLDVSLDGISFVSAYHLEPGRTTSLRTTFAGEAFHGDVRVCWSRMRSSGPHSLQFEVGGVFVVLEDDSRRVLQAFLKVSSRSQ